MVNMFFVITNNQHRFVAADYSADLQINRLYFIEAFSPVGFGMWPGEHHPGLGCEFRDQVIKIIMNYLFLSFPRKREPRNIMSINFWITGLRYALPGMTTFKVF